MKRTVARCGISLALALAATSLSAQTVVVTPGAPNGWGAASLLGTGSASITNTQARSGNGSLELYADNNGRARWQRGGTNFLAPSMGKLADLTSLSFDWFRAGESNVAAHFAPAFRLHVKSGLNTRELIWEYVYQTGYVPVVEDTWQTTNLMSQNFFFSNLSQCASQSNYNCASAQNGWGLTGDWDVIGISIGVGSGWGADKFRGFADNVTIGFGTAQATVYNFETTSVVPEPSSIALLAAGMIGLGFVARRKQTA